MQCPLHDGELIAHITHGENNLTVSYSTCPTCRGYWMDSFAANFIKLPHEEKNIVNKNFSEKYSCPICQQSLVRATGDNIPDTVFVYVCPDQHGYFFPAGQLAAFKNAQNIKITYHKLWNLPLPSIASVLLAGFALLVLTGGLAVTYTALQQRQQTASQAAQIFTNQKAYIDPQTNGVLFSATTSVDADIKIYIPSFNMFSLVMRSTDKRTHILYVPGIPSGDHPYYFSYTVQGNEQKTAEYLLIMP